MYYEKLLDCWKHETELRGSSMAEAPAFYRNLERTLDVARTQNNILYAKPRWDRSVLDWTSSDFLSLNRSGRIRQAFLEELAQHDDYELSAAGSRIQYGNYDYLIKVEKEVADFFKAPTALICHSGFIANVAMLDAVIQPGDAIVYDELCHTSTHKGMKLSTAAHKLPFKHNDVESLREVLSELKESNSEFEAGTKSVLIAVESVYSMDGDICPLRECVAAAKEIFPLGNAQFIIDEAHSTGTLGPKGAGLVAALGLEKEIAIRIHMCSKALASTGGLILCNETIRRVIMNQARFLTYSGAPSFPMVASIRAGIGLLRSGETQEAQARLAEVVTYFFQQLTDSSTWDEAVDEGILHCPLADDWESQPYLSHIIPIRCKSRYEQYLFFHLASVGMNAYAITYPTVPKGQTRVRLVFHAHNTREDVDRTVAAIYGFAEEMLRIEGGEVDETIPEAARKAYAWRANAV